MPCLSLPFGISKEADWKSLAVQHFSAQQVRYIVEKKLGESSGSAIYAIRSANGRLLNGALQVQRV